MGRVKKHGRDPATLKKSVAVGVNLPGGQEITPGFTPLSGSVDEIVGQLGEFRDQDLDHLIISLSTCTVESLENFSDVAKKLSL